MRSWTRNFQTWIFQTSICQKRWRMRIIALVAVTGILIYSVLCYIDRQGLGTPCSPAKGLEQERRQFTMVTGLFDIGRGNWTRYPRSYQKYLNHMTLILQYDINMIVFIEEKGVKFVKDFRRDCASRTKIYVTQFKELFLANYSSIVNKLVHSPEWLKDNERAKYEEVDGLPNYNIVTNSKTDLLYRAAKLDPFHTKYFFWIDSGWGHGHVRYFPSDKSWAPTKLFSKELDDKITIVQFGNLTFYNDKKDIVHKLLTDPVFASGFYGGTKQAVAKLQTLQSEVILKSLKDGITDDDQGSLLKVYYKAPKLFHHPRGQYFDVFHLFQ